MPKKTANSRGGAARNRPRPQKSVQLVRPASTEAESAIETDEEEVGGAVATTTAAPASTAKKTARPVVEAPAPSVSSVSRIEDEAVQAPRTASARMAARRQAAQKVQARQSPDLITAEHYSYVRKDLIFIAVLALLMLTTLIVLHFVPAIGG